MHVGEVVHACELRNNLFSFSIFLIIASSDGDVVNPSTNSNTVSRCFVVVSFDRPHTHRERESLSCLQTEDSNALCYCWSLLKRVFYFLRVWCAVSPVWNDVWVCRRRRRRINTKKIYKCTSEGVHYLYLRDERNKVSMVEIDLQL